jgi:hypothetical protein
MNCDFSKAREIVIRKGVTHVSNMAATKPSGYVQAKLKVEIPLSDPYLYV